VSQFASLASLSQIGEASANCRYRDDVCHFVTAYPVLIGVAAMRRAGHRAFTEFPTLSYAARQRNPV
jgi:hypothetical protein